jgi:hypothetical protein
MDLEREVLAAWMQDHGKALSRIEKSVAPLRTAPPSGGDGVGEGCGKDSI